MSPRVIRWSVLVAAMSLVVTWLFARRYFPARQQALAVAFLGYTNIYGGRAAVFSVSNQCNVEVKRWAAVYLESAPFAKTNTPRQWTMDQTFDTPDRYLRPKETERLFILETPPRWEWRLRVPWSTGIRARIIAHVGRKQSKMPLFLRRQLWRICPEYYASSDSVTQ